MENEFVNYTQALELKELGFDEPCFGYYDEDKYLFTVREQDSVESEWLKAPLYQQAFRWFREKCGLYGIPEERTLNNFSYQVKSNKEGAITFIVYGGYPLNFKSYKEAELACLVKLIEIVKNK
jgi:hypothetical protein